MKYVFKLLKLFIKKLMFSFHFGKKKLDVLTRNALLLCIVNQKLFIIKRL